MGCHILVVLDWFFFFFEEITHPAFLGGHNAGWIALFILQAILFGQVSLLFASVCHGGPLCKPCTTWQQPHTHLSRCQETRDLPPDER